MVGTKASGRPGGHPDIAEISRLYSTGPRTLLGKYISSQNSFKHGLYSKTYSLRGFSCPICEAKEICAFYEPSDGCPLYRSFLEPNDVWGMLSLYCQIRDIETCAYRAPTVYTIKIAKKLIKKFNKINKSLYL